MLASIIIPTHRPEFLAEAVASALEQKWSGDLEVVIVTDKVSVKYEDPRIRIIPFFGTSGSVGAIKRFGFGAARGDILIELDHDDLLHPQAVSKVADALTKTDFAYSNVAYFYPNFQAHTFGEIGDASGWKGRYRDVEFRGHILNEIVAFEPTPASIGHIWWAPDHVRAWTREGYLKAGGHDASMAIADDHDLVIRTYLSGSMAHIDECLYFYRVGVENTSTGDRNSLIQSETHRLYGKYIEQIVRRWCDQEKLPCFDLGGAHNAVEGWEVVDLVKDGTDLREKWPWSDSSVGAFRAFDFLEHLPNKMHTLSEMHRCLVPGGWALTCTPSALGRGAFQDPTHVSYWVKNSFRYVTEASLAKYIGNDDVRFQVQRLVEDNPWRIVNGSQGLSVEESKEIPYVTADLVALKPGYDGPGEKLI